MIKRISGIKLIIDPFSWMDLLKKSFCDPGKIWRSTPEAIKKQRDTSFRNIVNYAYTVPLYHKKYRDAGIHPRDITGINDITKLPFITKKDLIEHFPNEIIPPDYNKKNSEIICTSGSTGKPVSIYYDFLTMSQTAIISLRELANHDLHWKKSKCAHIGNFGRNKPDRAFEKKFFSFIKKMYHLNNHISLNAFDPIKDIVERLDGFKPDMILSYPATFLHLAYFKRKGFGKNINPKILLVGASVLDSYTKRYVEEAFGCNIYNIYSSTESGGTIAFECDKRTWHINYDYFHLETIDENMELLDDNNRGQIVVTRLFGKGTPIIRYTGMDDWVTLSPDYGCPCGLRTPIIKDGVEGRISASIFLPDGRIYPAASFAMVSKILNELNTHIVRQYQIVQKQLDEIDIRLVIDDDYRNIDPSVDIVFNRIKDLYQQKVGHDVVINVYETKNIKSKAGKPSPLVISHVKPEEGYRVIRL